MQVASVAFEHQRFADTYATHLTCEILRFNLPPKAHVTYVTHLTCEILRLINKHDLKDYLLTPRTNVRIASAKHQNAFKFAALTLRTNVRVASSVLRYLSSYSKSYAPHERAGCFFLLQTRQILQAVLRSARTCGLLRLALIIAHSCGTLTLRTNVRVASAKLHNCA